MLGFLFGTEKKRKRTFKYAVKRKVGRKSITLSRHYTKTAANKACKSTLGKCYVGKLNTYKRKKRVRRTRKRRYSRR